VVKAARPVVLRPSASLPVDGCASAGQETGAHNLESKSILSLIKIIEKITKIYNIK
jgi:hypothetical protein